MTAPKIDTAALSGIIERLEAGETGQEIDAYVEASCGDWPAEWIPVVVSQGVVLTKDGRPPAPGMGRWMCPERYSTSLDAAVALQERVLPGWRIYSVGDERHVHQITAKQGFYCGMDCLPSVREGNPYTQVLAFAPTEPAARLAAVLKAVIARESGNA